MTNILYEHPLNERIRGYLKLEQLFQQTERCLEQDIAISHTLLFSSIFNILDHLDRNDSRGDLIKDLEKLETSLLHWSKSPEINNDALQATLKKTVDYICQLRVVCPAYLNLKEDKLLSSIRQRFAIQGGNCSFDLPQLQFWLHQDHSVIEQDIQAWRNCLELIHNSIALILHFTREKSPFVEQQAQKGFYQDSGEGVNLIRIRIDGSSPIYPTISGNKFRYSIRFVEPCKENGKKLSKEIINFQLARC